MPEKRDGSPLRGVLVNLLALVVLMTAAFLMFRSIPGLRELVFKASPAGIELSARSDGEILAELDSVTRRGDKLPVLRDWLRRNYEQVDPAAEGLLALLGSKCPEISEPSIENYLARIAACDSDQFLGPLRRLSENRRPPFQRRAVSIRVSTPAGSQPPLGTGYTCYGGQFEHKKVRLLLAGTDRQFEVQVRGGYECDPGNSFPDLQLRAEDAVSLFGRPTRDIESVFALIV